MYTVCGKILEAELLRDSVNDVQFPKFILVNIYKYKVTEDLPADSPLILLHWQLMILSHIR